MRLRLSTLLASSVSLCRSSGHPGWARLEVIVDGFTSDGFIDNAKAHLPLNDGVVVGVPCSFGSKCQVSLLRLLGCDFRFVLQSQLTGFT